MSISESLMSSYYNFTHSDITKSNTAFGVSLAAGITGIVLNFVTLGVFGAVFSAIATAGFAVGCYYKGKNVKETQEADIREDRSTGFLHSDSKKETVSGVCALISFIAAPLLSVVTFGFSNLLFTAAVGAFCYYRGKLNKTEELDTSCDDNDVETHDAPKPV